MKRVVLAVVMLASLLISAPVFADTWDMIRFGRYKKLFKFVADALAENKR